MSKPKALFILDPSDFQKIYGLPEQELIAGSVDVYAPLQTRQSVKENPAILSDAEIIFSGWGGPLLDQPFLDSAPNLKAFFYGAGTMAPLLTPEVWKRGVRITCALEANAIPVAEYSLATILFSLKHGWRLSRQTTEQRRFADRHDAPGCFGSVVGLASLGATARNLVQLLKPFSLKVLAYDPTVSEEYASGLGVELVSLIDLFRRSDVVSVHTPLLDETIGLIGQGHFEAMKLGATFINTSRGPIVRHDELLDVAKKRRDLHFVLDVTDPEPPPADSDFYTLPNVVLTPHIAGSVGAECRRLGQTMIDELRRYLAGEPFRYPVTRDSIRFTSHRATTEVKVSSKVASRHALESV